MGQINHNKNKVKTDLNTNLSSEDFNTYFVELPEKLLKKVGPQSANCSTMDTMMRVEAKSAIFSMKQVSEDEVLKVVITDEKVKMKAKKSLDYFGF